MTSSTCGLITSLIQLVNEAQLFNIAFLFLCFGASPYAAVFGTFIVHLTCMNTSQFNLAIEVLSLI